MYEPMGLESFRDVEESLRKKPMMGKYCCCCLFVCLFVCFVVVWVVARVICLL